jgi:hypothetical protein
VTSFSEQKLLCKGLKQPGKKEQGSKQHRDSTMSLESDVKIPAAKFDRSTIDKQTLEFNEKLIKIWADGPRWYEVRRVFLLLPP